MVTTAGRPPTTNAVSRPPRFLSVWMVNRSKRKPDKVTVRQSRMRVTAPHHSQLLVQRFDRGLRDCCDKAVARFLPFFRIHRVDSEEDRSASRRPEDRDIIRGAVATPPS